MNEKKEILLKLLNGWSYRYIVIDTKFTKHHIEKLSSTTRDRGRFKWIAETKVEAFDKMEIDNEARRSHIDNGDLFPRLYFLADSMCNELFTWLQVRGLEITDITTPPL